MNRLKERYVFDWNRIYARDGYHIEYSITDICNRNCIACSHLAPLAKGANFVREEEFMQVTSVLHTFPRKGSIVTERHRRIIGKV